VDAAGLDGAGMLTIDGALLGTWNDDVIVAALQDGAIVRVFETGLQPPPPPANLTVVPSSDQHSLTIAGVGSTLAAGTYQVAVRVNGQQARLSPSITVS
jgi:hypothetical protein